MCSPATIIKITPGKRVQSNSNSSIKRVRGALIYSFPVVVGRRF
jgi:hypothetical protein